MSAPAVAVARDMVKSRSPRANVHALAVAVAVDLIAVALGGTISVLGRYFLGGAFELTFYLRMSVVVLLFIAVYAVLGLYPAVILHPVVELQGIFRGTTLTILLLGTLTFFQRDAEEYSRGVLIASWILVMIFVWVARVLAREWLSRMSWWGERAVVFGAGRAGRSVAEVLRRSPGTGLRVVAMLDDEPAKLELARGLAPITAPLTAASGLAEEMESVTPS